MLASLFVGLAMSLGHKGSSGVWVYRAGQDPGIMTAAWGQEPGASEVALVLVLA